MKSDTPNSERKEKKKRKKKEWKQKREKNLAASHPSVKGQRPRTLGITGDTCFPVPSFDFSLHYWLPAFWLRLARQESILYAGAEPVTQLTSDPSLQANEPSQHHDFLGSNSIFKPQPAETGGMRQRTYIVHSRLQSTSASYRQH